jgi:dynein intermediate chain 1
MLRLLLGRNQVCKRALIYTPHTPLLRRQLELTEEELKQEFTRILRADNPNAPDNIVRFSHKEHSYQKLATVEQCEIHFALDGQLVHQDSDEARRFRARRNM